MINTFYRIAKNRLEYSKANVSLPPESLFLFQRVLEYFINDHLKSNLSPNGRICCFQQRNAIVRKRYRAIVASLGFKKYLEKIAGIALLWVP